MNPPNSQANTRAHARAKPHRRHRRAFSVLELLIALTISSFMLSACLVALDGSFKSYERTTESASTHVVTRLVMYRMLAMIRQGEEFGPYPIDVVLNPRITESYIEFVSEQDPNDPTTRAVIRLERLQDPDRPDRNLLRYTRSVYTAGLLTATESGDLLKNIRDLTFTMEYDIGPRLMQATIDLAVYPDDVQNNATSMATGLDGRVLRLVASTSPRKLDE